ncbi:hypothetical protein T265_05925 [Opisthorchis viverrini]|uniref:Uncharacterized protein n=1 Tax=Opisthorchis viverrini TaxID=6198 RepID=A0A074ZIX4_OPIVI|nr:hypothetical protein T265_05925 [Opisthorchis viverrini]KER26946.1 hypothetical protein T265_05925 [Opisthorchis viverrini]
MMPIRTVRVREPAACLRSDDVIGVPVSHVRYQKFKSRHTIGYTPLMSSNKSETQVQCLPPMALGSSMQSQSTWDRLRRKDLFAQSREG